MVPITDVVLKRIPQAAFLIGFTLLLRGEVRISIQLEQEPTYLVVYVVDGETILLENGESVRYLGIDAPETQHPTRGLECFGPEATERNRQLVEGKFVRLEKDQTDRDNYDRLLRYVYVNDLFVNGLLIEEGYAFSYYYPPDLKHYQELLTLELKAEQKGLGLWSVCTDY
jgi:micrococcal nuclease